MLIELSVSMIVLTVAGYLGGVARVMLYERSIRKLSQERDRKLENLKHKGIRRSDFLSVQIERLYRRYAERIAWLEVNRTAILSRLPFFEG